MSMEMTTPFDDRDFEVLDDNERSIEELLTADVNTMTAKEQQRLREELGDPDA